LGKEAKLIETIRPRIEELPETATPETPTALDVLGDAPENGVASAPINDQRARVSQEDSVGVGPVAIEETAPESGDSSETAESNGVAKPDRESRRELRQKARAEKRQRPRAPLAEKVAATRDSATENVDELPEDSPPADDASIGAAEALSIDGSGNTSDDGTGTLTPALGEQEDAAPASARTANDPVLGGLNRHLSMMTLQLQKAEWLIDRVAAERNDFRQQLAELQGIPVEAIPMTSLDQIRRRPSRAMAGQSADLTGSPAAGIAVASPKRIRTRPSKVKVGQSADLSESAVQGIAVASPGQTKNRRSRETVADEPDEPTPPSVMSRLNYFSVDDIAVARKRRQMLALGLLVVIVGLWLASKMGVWRMPDNLSRDSLAQLPVIGELMSYFLAGWVMYRVVRVGSRGVKWVFPTEDKKHKRR